MNIELDENPRIKPICELLGLNFFVPRYQRGYRWGEQEITDLLNDISNYSESVKDALETGKSPGKFYCIQPIVVKKKEWKNENNDLISGWELIDGQQRLTSLLIILTFLEDIREHYDQSKVIYSIDFETRENCRTFFENKEFVTKIDDTNVDFYHISAAYHKYVKTWFKTRPTKRFEMLKTILGKDYNISAIWYEAKETVTKINSDEDSSISLFTRLNEGKIPLTDGELIKALLLQSDCYTVGDEKYIKQRLFEIANEWDGIESKLQDPEMWLFLNSDSEEEPTSKIQFIFNLLAERWNTQHSLVPLIDNKKPKHFEYLVIEQLLKNKRRERDSDDDILDPVKEIWDAVKEIASILDEWFEDHILYHYIGYLLAINPGKKNELITDLLSRKEDKDEFIKTIKVKIKDAVKIKSKRENQNTNKTLNELTYGSEDAEIRKILLLFNIQTHVKHPNEKWRFPYHLYKKEKISSIEHIHPQNPETITTDEPRCLTWMSTHIKTLTQLSDKFSENTEIKELISIMSELLVKFDKDSFEEVYRRTIGIYNTLTNRTDTEVHTLHNLALVDKDTNSALNNSFFDIKREILKENKLGRYIPICTQNAFSKYYSEMPDDMIFWSDTDRTSYYNAIEEVYYLFVN